MRAKVHFNLLSFTQGALLEVRCSFGCFIGAKICNYKASTLRGGGDGGGRRGVGVYGKAK